MKCMYCGSTESRVIDSRMTDNGASIRRRRECENCQRRFTTYEKIELMPIYVIKRDGRREPFDSEKVRSSILKACAKRPVGITTVDGLVSEVERSLANTLSQEVTSEQIGEMLMKRLKEIDEVAYVRFASVYRQFKDINSFMTELQHLLEDEHARREP